jgi:hypothetical protein
MMQVGDDIAIFKNIKVPFLLRAAGSATLEKPSKKKVKETYEQSAYHLVGEAFVQGIMKAEVLLDNSKPEGKPLFEDILLT